MTIKDIVEALLFAADKPLSVTDLRNLFPEWERPDREDVRQALEALAADYADRAVCLNEVASGYRFQVHEAMSPWVARLFEERPPRYSRALLETLAIIAYRQPVTRGDIEEIRGVAVSSNIIRTLLDRDWVRVVAHKEVPGRPALYGTTKSFLDYFNLKSLHELPPLADLQAMGETSPAPLDHENHDQSQTHETAPSESTA